MRAGTSPQRLSIQVFRADHEDESSSQLPSTAVFRFSPRWNAPTTPTMPTMPTMPTIDASRPRTGVSVLAFAGVGVLGEDVSRECFT